MLFFELEVIYFCPGDYYTNIANISIKINKPILENNLDNTSLQNCFSALTDKLGQRRHKNDKLTDWTQVNRCKIINFNKSTYLHLQNIPSNQLNRFLKIRVCFSNLFYSFLSLNWYTSDLILILIKKINTFFRFFFLNEWEERRECFEKKYSQSCFYIIKNCNE